MTGFFFIVPPCQILAIIAILVGDKNEEEEEGLAGVGCFPTHSDPPGWPFLQNEQQRDMDV